jgi:hypothetical protein
LPDERETPLDIVGREERRIEVRSVMPGLVLSIHAASGVSPASISLLGIDDAPASFFTENGPPG